MTGQHEFEFEREERRVKCIKCGAYQGEVDTALCPERFPEPNEDMTRRGYVEESAKDAEEWEI